MIRRVLGFTIELGWIYLTEMCLGSTWFYSEGWGWIWTLPVFHEAIHSSMEVGSLSKGRYFDYVPVLGETLVPVRALFQEILICEEFSAFG